MNSSPVRVGLIGAGPWAEVHGRHLAEHPDIELVGVWARRPEAARRMGAEVSTRVFTRLEDLMEDSEAVDLAVPPSAQPTLAIRAAERGCHLLLEKPIAATLDDARLLDAACRNSGVVTQVMLTRRFHPLTRSFLDRCTTELPASQVDGISARYVHGAFLGGAFATPWRLQEGVLLDLGPHLLDLVEQIAGPITVLRAQSTARHVLALTAEHEHGALSQMVLSGHSAGPSTQQILAFGAAGKQLFDARDVDEKTCFDIALSEFAAAVRTGSPVVADVGRGLHLQSLLEQAKASLSEG